MTQNAQFSYMRVAVSVSATLWFLIMARDVVQPMLIAFFVWFLLGALARWLGKILEPLGMAAPWTSKALSAICIFGGILVVSAMVAGSVEQVASELPVYEARLDAMIATFAGSVGVEATGGVSDALGKIDIAPAALSALGTAVALVTALIIVVVYIIFINQEAGAIEQKLAKLMTDPERREEVAKVGEEILKDIEIYISVKVLLGLFQAVPTYAVLALVGVDAPIFWAVIIFLFSFIPTIGTLIGIVFPALMALLQFDTLVPFFTVLVALVPVQLFASNFLEPKLMGDRLNLSPLIVFVGIFAGGAIWGIIGALVIVPLLAIAVIVFSRIPSMRSVAILMSRDGELGTGSDGKT